MPFSKPEILTAAVIGSCLTAVADSPAQAGVSAASVCPAPESTSHLTQTFTSNFTRGGALDRSMWAPFSGQSVGNPANEAQAYSPEQVAVRTGTGLRLTTQPGQLLGKPYRSGAVTTKGLFSQTYGRFEMMARMPQQNGMWPAFWLMPANGTWPPEIDVIEYIYAPEGHIPVASASAPNFWIGSNPATTLHWPPGNQQAAPAVHSNITQPWTYQDWNEKPAPPGWSDAYRGYHVYAVDWRPGSVTFIIDDAPVFCVIDTASTGKRVPSVPMYMLVNDAVTNGTKSNPAWPGFVDDEARWPQVMDVAYVRVSQFKDLSSSGPSTTPAKTAPAPSAPAPSSPAPSSPAPSKQTSGAVGSDKGKVLSTLTSADPNLCRAGTVTKFTSNATSWTWTCAGSGGGGNMSGVAFKSVTGVVGPDKGKTFSALGANDPGLCKSGQPLGFRAVPTGWVWECVGRNGGRTDVSGSAVKRT